MNHSTTLIELTKALVATQKVLKTALRNAENPFFKHNYADLDAVWSACRDALTTNGLAVTQLPAIENGEQVLETILLHTSGEWLSSTLRITVAKPNDPQAVGSALTYARRYALAAIVGVVTAGEDDDGNAATQPTRTARKAPAPHQTTKADVSPRGKQSPDIPIIGNLVGFMSWAQGTYGYKNQDALCADMGVKKVAQIIVMHKTWPAAVAYLTSFHAPHDVHSMAQVTRE